MLFLNGNLQLTNICDIKFFLNSFPGDEHQHHLLTFLCKVGDRYKETGRSKEFIPDLLQLNVPQLFIIPADANQEMEEASVGQKFSSFLKSYIQRNNLQSVILDNMQTILSKFTDKSDINFHWIILSVLQSVSLCLLYIYIYPLTYSFIIHLSFYLPIH